jgi:hypothetical protein
MAEEYKGFKFRRDASLGHTSVGDRDDREAVFFRCVVDNRDLGFGRMVQIIMEIWKQYMKSMSGQAHTRRRRTRKMAVTCEFCEQEMKPGVGCTLKEFDDIPGGPHARLPYSGPGKQCHDCSVFLGQIHHPGCDVERCPACGGQAFCCGCTDETDER